MASDYKLGIGLVPIREDQERIYRLVEELGLHLEVGFKTESGISIPHITLFQGMFENEEEINHIGRDLDLTDLSQEHFPVGISIWAQKILFLNLTKERDLLNLHYEAFARAFPLCAGKPADTQKLEGITREQQRSLDRTGSPFVGDTYLPHFTLAHLAEVPEDFEETEEELNKVLETCIKGPLKFDKLVVYEVGELGACKRIIYERSLGDE